MIRDIRVDFFEQVQVYDNLCSDHEKPLYLRCSKFTWLTEVIRLVNVKVTNEWSDKSFTGLLELLKDMFRKRDMSTKGPPTKMLWYLHIIPRFKRLFANAKDAKNMMWHAYERLSNGKLCHLVHGHLIEDLKMLWEEGVDVYDRYHRDSFKIRHMPPSIATRKEGNLPWALEILEIESPISWIKKSFQWLSESEIALDASIGEEVYQRLKDINVVFGKTH
ncbi:hypothetical protein L6164_037374 [Bauhinia variegata]|uniref:Uncharacterized protein n=1 Tax=Bauhinia variegata TaxID=167791 RepID=A0ACB9KK38_BAUVA|nr:hypothetical protein L6164_037374 [Bauhinia variegata]